MTEEQVVKSILEDYTIGSQAIYLAKKIAYETKKLRTKKLKQPVSQPTIKSCFRACVASIFGVDVESITRTCDGNTWNWDEFQKWLYWRHNKQAIEISLCSNDNINHGILYPTAIPVKCILTGVSPRNKDILHAVVAETRGLEGFEIIHDPYPDGPAESIVGFPTHVTYFVNL